MTPASDSPAASGIGTPSLPDRIAALALAHPVATAILIFAASRVVVWLGVIFADLVIAPNSGPRLWNVGEFWFHRLLRWDAGWYMRIVREGYAVGATPQAEASIAFFPLLPALARGLSAVTGLRGFDALLVVGNLASVAAVGLLAALVRPMFGPKVAILSAAILAFTPTSVFLSSAYTEQLALALVLLIPGDARGLVLGGGPGGGPCDCRPAHIRRRNGGARRAGGARRRGPCPAAAHRGRCAGCRRPGRTAGLHGLAGFRLRRPAGLHAQPGGLVRPARRR